MHGTSEMPENLVPPSKAPTTPPPVRHDRGPAVDSILVMLAETQRDVIRLREQVEIANARIDELQRQLAAR